MARPQDTAQKGPGQIKLQGNLLIGKGTEFLKLNKRDKILDKKSAEGYMLKNIVSDTEIIVLNAKADSDEEGRWSTDWE